MNRQNYPNSVFPLTGDVTSTTGESGVVVEGIQKTPFAPDPPQTGQIPVMNSDGSWHPEDPVVSGTDAPGTSPTKNPVQVAGIDESNLVRELRTDSYGSLRAVSLEELMAQNLAATKALLAAFIEVNNLIDSDYDLDNYTE